MEKPLVSVIIPLYNGERYIVEALESVFKQDYSPFEVIVVDDGSTDQSATLVKTFPQVRYIYQKNQGNAVARNVGISQARGEFCAFLDQDDLWAADKLSVQVDRLIRNPELGFVVGCLLNFLDTDSPPPLQLRRDFLSDAKVAYLPGSLLVRKSVFGRLGLFNPDFRYGSDSDFFFKAKDAKISMEVCPEILLYRRVHAENLSHSIQASNADLLKLIHFSIQRQRQGSPLISAIIPVHNCEKYLKEAIDSVLAQTYRPIEIIIVDDGSTDSSAQVAKGFGSQVIVYSQEKKGIGGGRNSGIDLAKGSFFAFLDSDDLWTEDKLEKQMAFFKKDPDLDMVFGNAIQFVSPELEGKNYAFSPDPMSGYVAGTLLVKREAFFRAGYFSTEWKLGEFVDWYARALEKKLKGVLFSEVVLKRRIHLQNTGIRENHSRLDYVRVLKASLDRRKAMESHADKP